LTEDGWIPHEAEIQAELGHAVLFFTTDEDVAMAWVSKEAWERHPVTSMEERMTAYESDDGS